MGNESESKIDREQRDAVLLVEDDPAIAEALRRMLDDYDVHHSGNATDAIRRLTERRWTALVVDIGLPEGELAGIEVLRAAQAHDSTLPLLAITGLLASSEATSNAIALGGHRIGVSIIPKPVPREDLRRFMADAVRTRMPLQRFLEERGFSPREAELVVYLAEGGTMKDFAETKGLSLSTVKTYRLRALERGRAASIQELILSVEKVRLRR